MIDPKELKIGNYIFDEEGCIVKITGFQPHGHSTRCDEPEGCILLFDIYSEDGKIREGYENENDSCNHISLTLEWLDRFDFKLKEESLFENIKMKYWVNNAVCLFFNDDEPNSFLLGYGFNVFDGKYYAATLRWINQLHILQNSFHSLTGKELTIKSFNQSN